MSNQKEQSLLDLLAKEMHCEYLSDLKFVDNRCRKEIARTIRLHHPVESASFFEWNDALHYLTGSCFEKTEEEARNKLVSLLQG